jgi:hypothetical protein
MVHEDFTLLCGDEVTSKALDSCATSRKEDKYEDGSDPCSVVTRYGAVVRLPYLAFVLWYASAPPCALTRGVQRRLGVVRG